MKRNTRTEKERERRTAIGAVIFLALFGAVYLAGWQFRAPAQGDYYRDMKELLRKEPSSSYEITVKDTQSPVLVITPHGGKIEQFTSAIGRGIAGEDHRYFEFAGLLTSGSFDRLHVTSSNFNPPQLEALSRQAEISLSVQGMAGDEALTYVGGRDESGAQTVIDALNEAGFRAQMAPSKIGGREVRNFVNRNRRRMGIQLEITRAQRRALFTRGNESRPDEDYDRYVAAVRRALAMIAQKQQTE